MTATQSLRLYKLTLEFVKGKEKAKEHVNKIIEEVVDTKKAQEIDLLFTKDDKVDVISYRGLSPRLWHSCSIIT